MFVYITLSLITRGGSSVVNVQACWGQTSEQVDPSPFHSVSSPPCGLTPRRHPHKLKDMNSHILQSLVSIHLEVVTQTFQVITQADVIEVLHKSILQPQHGLAHILLLTFLASDAIYDVGASA